jgi:PadR family transcriptional regulator PadR
MSTACCSVHEAFQLLLGCRRRRRGWVFANCCILCPANLFKAHLDNLQYAGVDNHSMGKPSDLVQGTLDLLILKTVSLEPKHGWAIAKRIQQISGEVLQVQQGSLYPALHRLEQKAWIKAKWKETDTGRQAKFYSLTAAGRAQLEKETENWSRLSAAIKLVVETT